MATRLVKYSGAILEALDRALQDDKNVTIMGLGVTDPMGIFGTTKGLAQKYPQQVVETPTAENGTMGVALGAALVGLKPLITHQRVEFALLAIEQITNQAAKWNYMTGGVMPMPLVLRLIIGRGWGQGPQHSQSLDPWFAHVPGLKVIAPSNPYDAKGMLTAAINDQNPVVILEHRWLHNTIGHVPEEHYSCELSGAKVMLAGKDVTIVTYSYMVNEAISVTKKLRKIGINAEVIDLRCHRPMDNKTILESVRKTGRLITIDNGWVKCGIGAEIISDVVLNDISCLKKSPSRLGILDVPIPSTRALANSVYPGAKSIAEAVSLQLETNIDTFIESLPSVEDIPNKEFTGPF